MALQVRQLQSMLDESVGKLEQAGAQVESLRRDVAQLQGRSEAVDEERQRTQEESKAELAALRQELQVDTRLDAPCICYGHR